MPTTFSYGLVKVLGLRSIFHCDIYQVHPPALRHQIKETSDGGGQRKVFLIEPPQAYSGKRYFNAS
jgi:hypothetical protein